MKCHQYWPNPDSSTTYGDFTVTCHNEEGNSAFIVREMTLLHIQVTNLNTHHTHAHGHTHARTHKTEREVKIRSIRERGDG